MVFFIFVIMDSLSQIVLGAAVSNAFLGKKIGNKSILYGALIGTIPDLDVWIATFFYDPITQIEVHRGFSHSIIFYLLLSILIAFGIQKIEKKTKISFYLSYLTVFLILLTHSLLDIFTTWGTELFWPFYNKIAIKSIFVIDPLYTFPFLICLIISMTKQKNNSKRFFWNNLGLLCSTSYLFLTILLKVIVYNKVVNELKNNHINFNEVVVKPTAMNTILWNVIIETDDRFLLSDYSFFDTKPMRFQSHLKQHNYIKDIEKEPIIIQLKKISENQFIITNKQKNLFFNDLRFGLLNKDSADIKYAFSYELYKDGDVWKAKQVEKENRDGIALLKKIAVRLKGN